MKIKLLMAALLGFVSATAFAQPRVLKDAQESYNNYQVSNSGGVKIPALVAKAKTDLNDAKTAIDKAAAGEKTATLPLTYALKAVIYASLANADSVKTNALVEYNTASDALKQAKTADTKNENTKLIDDAGKNLAQFQLNKGIEEFQNKKYSDAYQSFTNARQFVPNDTSLMLNAAIAATSANNYPAAISSYNTLLASNYTAKNKVYNDLPRIYLMNKDSAGAMKVIDEALVKYPTNGDLRKEEIEIALQTGKLNDITGKLDAAIANDPKNKVLYYYQGLTYTQIGDAANANSKKLKDTDPAKKSTYQTANDNYTKAQASFKKALDIDPSYFEAVNGMGFVLMRPAVDDFNLARETKDDKQYTMLRKKADAEFEEAKPYLQKAVDLKPTSVDALTNLRNYYRGVSDPAHATENAAKAADLKKQIDALPGGGK
jgi:Flp pilus assembly protein TadD